MSKQSDYVQQVYETARAMGMSDPVARLAAAQSAVETQYGTRLVGNNYFGIKAGSSWTGPSVAAGTKEETGGTLVSTRAKFRAYPSFEASLADWYQTIGRRWPEVLQANSVEEAAAALKAGKPGGYATDSQYASKLLTINNRYAPDSAAPVPATPSPALVAQRQNPALSAIDRLIAANPYSALGERGTPEALGYMTGYAPAKPAPSNFMPPAPWAALAAQASPAPDVPLPRPRPDIPAPAVAPAPLPQQQMQTKTGKTVTIGQYYRIGDKAFVAEPGPDGYAVLTSTDKVIERVLPGFTTAGEGTIAGGIKKQVMADAGKTAVEAVKNIDWQKLGGNLLSAFSAPAEAKPYSPPAPWATLAAQAKPQTTTEVVRQDGSVYVPPQAGTVAMPRDVTPNLARPVTTGGQISSTGIGADRLTASAAQLAQDMQKYSFLGGATPQPGFAAPRTTQVQVPNPAYQVYMGQLAANQRITPTGAVIGADAMRAISDPNYVPPKPASLGAPPPKTITETRTVAPPPVFTWTTSSRLAAPPVTPATRPGTAPAAATGAKQGLFGINPMQMLSGFLASAARPAPRGQFGQPLAVGGTYRDGAVYAANGSGYGGTPGQSTAGLKTGERVYDTNTGEWGLKVGQPVTWTGSSSGNTSTATGTFKGTSTGNTYTVGKLYTTGNGTYQAMPDGTFKRV